MNLNGADYYSSKSHTITKEEFEKYLDVQKTGNFNMFLQYEEAMKQADLSEEKYFTIVFGYNVLVNKFQSKSQMYKYLL